MSVNRVGEEEKEEEKYPTIASSENFEVWEDREEGTYIVAFNLNGLTVTVDRELLEEFADVIERAQQYERTRRILR